MTDDFSLPQSPRTTVILSWLAWVLLLLSGALLPVGGLLAVYAAAWAAPTCLTVATILAGVSSEIRRRLPSAERIAKIEPAALEPPSGPTTGPLKALLLVLLLGAASASCTNPTVTALRATATARATAVLARDTLYEVCHVKRVRCLEINPVGSQGYDTCWAACRKAEEHWVRYGRPAVNSAIVAAIGAIQAAELAKQKPNWLVVIKPLACALAESLKQWGHLLPPGIQAQAQALASLAAGATCQPLEVP